MIDYITIKEHNSRQSQLMFVDFKYSIEPLTEENSGFENVSESEIFTEIFTKNIEITKEYNEKNIHNEFIEIIKGFNLDDSIITKKTKGKELTKVIINNHSNYIVVDGRIGKAQYIILSEDNYKKYKDVVDSTELKIIFENSLENEIYLYRKNKIDQPGIVMIQYTDSLENMINYEIIKLKNEVIGRLNDNKTKEYIKSETNRITKLINYNSLLNNVKLYNLVSVGFFPEKQFSKIIL